MGGGLFKKHNYSCRSKTKKSVSLISCLDNPLGGDKPSTLLERAKGLKHAQIQLQFLPLPTPGRLFDIGALWRT